MSEHTFYLKVTVKTDEDNPEPQPQDFATFLNTRFTVSPTATYGLDSYNKDAPQLITGVSVAPDPAVAWDLGRESGFADYDERMPNLTTNPYRETP